MHEKDCVLASKCVGVSVFRMCKSWTERKDSSNRPRVVTRESPHIGLRQLKSPSNNRGEGS